jgi:hypothetical protein
MKRSYYSNSIKEFLDDDETKILGELSLHHRFALEDLQKNAWVKQINILKESLKSYNSGHVYFEFLIPRMGKRVDNIVLIDDLIFILEFKVGDAKYQKHSLEQVIDYCLDLRNFHEGSHYAKLVPVLISTNAETVENVFQESDNLFEPVRANQYNLAEIINSILSQNPVSQINAEDWENSVYKPTPTIIEAAQALYKGHNVREISRHDAGAINLSKTASAINQIIENSKAQNVKSICFVTGVPGAGKTLAGLNIANERSKSDVDEHAVFLSGNGPLVDVLREALTRDAVQTAKEQGETSTKKKEKERAVKFIQNIHHFRDDNLISAFPPIEKVVVFDEAQRAWTKEMASSFMRQKRGKDDFAMLEPEFLISVMNRHQDWCVIVCLIGGGQEINTGEAGLSEWIEALKSNFQHWNVYYSNQIVSDANYLSDEDLKSWLKNQANEINDLHLSVSVRSFRSERVSELMHKILDNNVEDAKALFDEIKNKYPIVLTRNLARAKSWLKENARGTERYGIVASSGGRRLRPCGIDVKNEISAPNWFLNDSEDVRSSYFLEDTATEFDIQGLEIDWICLAWDINLFYKDTQWNYQNFSGTKWNKIHNHFDRKYLLNTYRVLLTRARQGLVIFIPFGDNADFTRPIELYDKTFEYLQNVGFSIIN